MQKKRNVNGEIIVSPVYPDKAKNMQARKEQIAQIIEQMITPPSRQCLALVPSEFEKEICKGTIKVTEGRHIPAPDTSFIIYAFHKCQDVVDFTQMTHNKMRKNKKRCGYVGVFIPEFEEKAA